MRTWTIGSDLECDLVVDQQTVSRRHCRLSLTDSGYLIEDLGSSNGTFVNGERINTSRRVTRGDRITLGLTALMPWPAEGVSAGQTAVTIGREPDNDIVINLPAVSGHHARVTWDLGSQQAVIEDLASANGTAIGSPERKIARSLISASDTIYLGSHALPAAGVVARLQGVTGSELTFDTPSLLIGRDADCDLMIDKPMVSGRHARLVRRGEQILIEDLGSSNGTYVNGHKVDHESRVAEGDTIGLGSHTLTLRLAPVSVQTVLALSAIETARAERIEAPRHGHVTGDSIKAQRSGDLVSRLLQFQAPLIAAAIIVGFRQDRGSMLFWFGLASIWFGLSSMVSANVLNTHWCSEIWATGGVQRVSILFGRIVVHCAIQCLLAWGVIELGGVLECPAIPLLGLILLASAVGLGVGLVIISIDPRMKTRWTLVATTIALLCLLGGGPQTRSWLPSWTGPIASATPTRWAFEGLLLLEAGKPTRPTGSDVTATAPLAAQAEYLFPATSDQMGIRADVLALALMGFGYLALAAFISAEPRRR